MRLPYVRSALLVMLVISGCTSPLFCAESPDTEEVAKAPQPETGVMLVKDYALPWNCQDLKVEGVALVTQLKGTGSDPPPSSLARSSDQGDADARRQVARQAVGFGGYGDDPRARVHSARCAKGRHV